MKNTSSFMMGLITAASLAFTVFSSGSSGTESLSKIEPAAKSETAYERVMRTNTLRCGYVSYAPLLSKDPNTGAISGIGAEVMEKIAANLKVKIEWTEETSWATYIQGLESKRFDALCTLDFFLPAYAGRLEAPKPIFYTGIGVYKRMNDNRFAEGFHDFNKEDVSISAIDGSLSSHIQISDFPKAQLVSMPHNTEYAFILQSVVDKKADITFVENSIANNYLKANPGTLVNISADKPLRIYPYFVPVAAGETSLKNAFDGLIEVMIENGDIEKILSKYEQNGQKNFYRVAQGYK